MCEFKTNNFLINVEVNKYLESIIQNKLFANGYIFYGAEGIGKKETALNFVKQIFKQIPKASQKFSKVFLLKQV